MAQWDPWHLGSTRTQVQSLVWHSGLRIWHCCTCGLGHNFGSDLIPGLGTPYASGQPKKRKIVASKARTSDKVVWVEEEAGFWWDRSWRELPQ